MDNSIVFSENASAQCIRFDGFKDCAAQTRPFIEQGTVALSGGATYDALFPQWAALNPDVAHAQFYAVDERMVPFEHEASNWRNAYEKFLRPLQKQSEKAHWPETKAHYEKMLAEAFDDAAPVFDAVFLGIGDDGHTASLFPGGDYLDDSESVVLQTVSPKPPVSRITLAPRTIISARRAIAVLAGIHKKDILQRITEKDDSLPIVKIFSRRQHSQLYIDAGLWSFYKSLT